VTQPIRTRAGVDAISQEEIFAACTVPSNVSRAATIVELSHACRQKLFAKIFQQHAAPAFARSRRIWTSVEVYTAVRASFSLFRR